MNTDMVPPDLDPETQQKLETTIADALEAIAIEFKDIPQTQLRLAMFLGVRSFYIAHDPEVEKNWALISRIQTDFLSPGWSKE